MPEQKPGDSGPEARVVKKLTLPDGFRVGILNLDKILKEVADLKLTDTQKIKVELIERVKECNYVPSGSENEYSTALFREYQRRFEVPEMAKDAGKIEIHKHSGG